MIDGNETTIRPKTLMLESQSGSVGLGIIAFGEEEVTLAEDQRIELDDQGDVKLIASDTLSYQGKQSDPPGIQYSDEALKAEDKSQREAHNQEVFQAREKESKAKFNIGAAVAVAGIVIVAVAASALTAGAGTPAAVAMAAGAIGGICGAAQMDEATLDLGKMESGDFSQSYNVVRDGILGGNEDQYQAVMYGSIMIGASMLAAPLGSKLSLVARGFCQAGTTGTLSTGIMFLEDASDGYIDQGGREYLANFAGTAAITGFGYAVAAGAGAIGSRSKLAAQILSKSGAYRPVLIIGAETVVDVGVDWASSQVFGTEFDVCMSFLTHLVSNVTFSIDPVNMATGGFYLEATDLSLPDRLEEPFYLKRYYHSVISCRGVLGKNWMLGLESRIFFQEEQGLADVLCVDGHAERFYFQEGVYQNRRGGDQRYQLRELPGGTGYVLTYLPEQTQYHYDSVGRLLTIQGTGTGCLTIRYEKNQISHVTTSAGYRLEFLYEKDRIVEVRDDTGRTIRYQYQEERLKAVCHVDEGVSTYHYDEQHYLSQVIDQNGTAYVRNEYDHKGRVITQYYPDGTRSTVEYHPERMENTVWIESLGRRERYVYNQDHLVTHTWYDDGTVSETGYDAWTNRNYEKDRNGWVTQRRFHGYGMLLEERLPSGQIWTYTYDERQRLIVKQASTGEESRYVYDASGFVAEEETKIRDGIWRRRCYERDGYGRIRKETDSRGASTHYTYEKKAGHILMEPEEKTDALGQTTRYTYDIAGRIRSVTTEEGTLEFGYNKQNYVTCIQDGGGNETKRAYDPMGNLTALFPPNQGGNDPGWMYTYFISVF